MVWKKRCSNKEQKRKRNRVHLMKMANGKYVAMVFLDVITKRHATRKLNLINNSLKRRKRSKK